MGKDKPEQQRRAGDMASAIDEPREPPVDRKHGDAAPDLAVEPEPPAEDEEDVRRMWKASDPIEGEAPTG